MSRESSMTMTPPEPAIEPTAYVPRSVKENIRRLGDRVEQRLAAAGLPHRAGGPKPIEDGLCFPPPSFNLCSALHHACGGVAFIYECSVGVKTAPYPLLTHEQVLDLELLFFDELFRYAVAHPTRWLSEASKPARQGRVPSHLLGLDFSCLTDARPSGLRRLVRSNRGGSPGTSD